MILNVSLIPIMKELTGEELKRYRRHLVLDEFGLPAQLALKNSSVLVVGTGELGCPALLYLTAAGVGTSGIADGDTLDVTNIQRQLLYTTEDVGKNKAIAAATRLAALNPHVKFQ